MIIQGPLALNWRRRKWGFLPRLENGAITAEDPPTPRRIELWSRQDIHVAGRPEWVFPSFSQDPRRFTCRLHDEWDVHVLLTVFAERNYEGE